MAGQLPNNDPDLKLAQQLKKLREQGRPLSELDDPMIQDLLDYKRKKERSEGTESSDKQAVWNHISLSTKPRKEASITSFFSSNTFRWAAAAVLLIVGIFSFMYLQSGQPELLAASGESIETVTLNDGSMVTLRPHSKLFAVSQEATAARYTLQGEGQFEVAHNPDRRFSVKTQTGTVSVLGTRFILSSWGQQTQVFLRKGSVKIEAPQQADSVILSPGESASVTRNKPIAVIKEAEANEFTDWINQQLVFNNKPVRQVANELEQQFDISITLPSQIAQNKLSGSFSLKDLQTALDDLELVLNGLFTKTGKRDYTFKMAAQ